MRYLFHPVISKQCQAIQVAKKAKENMEEKISNRLTGKNKWKSIHAKRMAFNENVKQVMVCMLMRIYIYVMYICFRVNISLDLYTKRTNDLFSHLICLCVLFESHTF